MTHSDYLTKVLNTQSANLLAFWPFDEGLGTVADNAEGTAAKDAAFEGGYILQSRAGPFSGGASFIEIDGIDGRIDLETVTYNTESNGKTGTLLFWIYPEDIADWSDGSQNAYFHMRSDSGNEIKLRSPGSPNSLDLRYEANNVAEFVQIADVHTSAVGWWMIACTWSDSDNASELKLYFWDGSTLQSNTETSLGVYTTDAPFQTVLGADRTGTNQNSNVSFAYCGVWSTVLTSAEITNLTDDIVISSDAQASIIML